MEIDNITPDDVKACAEKDGKEWSRRNAENNGEGVEMLDHAGKTLIVHGYRQGINNWIGCFEGLLVMRRIVAFPDKVQEYLRVKGLVAECKRLDKVLNKPAECVPTDEELLADAKAKGFVVGAKVEIPQGDILTIAGLYVADQTECQFKDGVVVATLATNNSPIDFPIDDIRLVNAPKKLVPFNLSDPNDRDFLRGKWVRSKYDGREIALNIFEKGCGCVREWLTMGYSTMALFEDFTFLDDSPCGKEVE